jgi:hypothetical protein
MRRRNFIAASATVAALAAGACARGSADELQLVEPSKDFDYAAFRRLVAKAADVRQVWDVGSNPPEGLSGIKNALNGYRFGYNIPQSRTSVVACLHNEANMIAYDDAAWQKYSIGQAMGLKDAQGNPLSDNIFAAARAPADPSADPNDPHGMYQDPTLQTLQRRGVVVFACHTGAAEHARMLVANGSAPQGWSEERVLQDLLAHVVAGVIVVPSAVATMGLLQSRFGYGYISANA